MALTRDDVRHVAKLARIGLADDELDRYLADLAGIFEHIGRIAELDLSGVPPTSHPLDLVNHLGPGGAGADEPWESWPRAKLLALAPDPAPDGFRVPPIGAEPSVEDATVDGGGA
jgi:aspartyl-tRNA(Asn)/glutamyl-tRNA(Gln) amidotransferase subunit C